MSSRRRHLSGMLSRRVADNVRRLGPEKGISAAELIDRAGFKPNYYYVRMRQEIGFSLADLEALGHALNVAPDALLLPMPESASLRRMDGRELAARLRLLQRTYGHGTDIDQLVEAVRVVVPGFTAEDWAGLIAGDGPVLIDPEVLDAVASYFHIDPAYLAELAIDDAVERVKAELELQDALREVGATTVAARSLGEASPSALRAIAAALRARPGS